MNILFYVFIKIFFDYLLTVCAAERNGRLFPLRAPNFHSYFFTFFKGMRQRVTETNAHFEKRTA